MQYNIILAWASALFVQKHYIIQIKLQENYQITTNYFKTLSKKNTNKLVQIKIKLPVSNLYKSYEQLYL